MLNLCILEAQTLSFVVTTSSGFITHSTPNEAVLHTNYLTSCIRAQIAVCVPSIAKIL